MSALVEFDVLRDSRHREAKSARDQADWLAWLELGGIRPRTLYDYEWATARAMRMFPSKTLAEFTDGDLLHVFKTFPEGGRRERVAAYRSWFKWAVQTRRIERSPMELLPSIRRRPQPKIDTFTEAEVEALLGLDIVDAAPLAVLLEAGLRKGEARHLQLRHCALETSRLIVLNGKGGRDRVIPMTTRLRSLLADLALVEGMEQSGYIFYAVRANAVATRRTRHKPVGEGTFARWWRTVLKRAGVRYRKPHTARHTYATNWRRRGLGIDEIQLLLGHASIRTTSDLYVHTQVEDVARHIALIEAAEV